MKALITAIVLIAGCGGSSDDPGPDARADADTAADANVGTAISYTVFASGGWQAEPDDVVLVRDGDAGPWRRLDGVDGVYRTHVVGPRYVIARACRTLDLSYGEVWVFHMHLDDTHDLRDIGCRVAVDGIDGIVVSGTLTGVASNQRARVQTSRGSVTTFPGATDFTLLTGRGLTDLVAGVFPSAQPRRVQRLVIDRDRDITADVTRDIDFDTEGFAPVEHTITVPDTGSGGEGLSVRLSTANGDYTIENMGYANDTYRAPPADRLLPGDLISVSRSTSDGSSSRGVTVVTSVVGDLTATLPPAYPAAPPTLVTTATNVSLAGTLPIAADADYYEASALQYDDFTGQFTFWNQVYTARWADGQPIDYVFEDFSAIEGWTVGLTTETEIQWAAQVISSTLQTALPPGVVGFGFTPADGQISTRAGQTGTLTP